MANSLAVLSKGICLSNIVTGKWLW